jgi:hypothetical protein
MGAVMNGSAHASPPLLPRPRVWDWALLLLLAPILVPLLLVQFVVGLFLAPPLPADDAEPAPEPKPRRRARRPTTEPIAVDVDAPGESVDVEPVGVSPRAPYVAFPVEGGVPYGGFIGTAPYRFRGG